MCAGQAQAVEGLVDVAQPPEILPPRRQLDGDPTQYRGSFEADQKVRQQ